MKLLGKALIIPFICLLLILSQSIVIQGNLESPPDPVPIENIFHINPMENKQGTWYLGATPPEVKKGARPIVFVQGLKGRAWEWWRNTEYHGMNDMYVLAYKSGYRTAFVELCDEIEGPVDQYENGKMLAKLLHKISEHFGEEVDVVAHSKGGVDTQVAATYWGAYRFIDKIITIGSPHHGTNLADLLCSWYGNWIVKALGANGSGTAAMQTANMAQFRDKTDHHPNIHKNKYYTASGTDWGPAKSMLWLGGYYLSRYGENDGLIEEQSTHLTYAKHLFIAPLDHDLLRKGSAVWDKVEPVLGDANKENPSDQVILNPLSTVSAQTLSGKSEAIKMEVENDQFITGGALAPGNEESKEVILDSREQTLFTIFTKSSDVKVSLHSPSGVVYSNQSKEYTLSEGKGIISNAALQSFHLLRPEIGKWRIELYSESKDAYLITTSTLGKKRITLKVPQMVQGETVPVQIELNEEVKSKIHVEMKVIGPDQRKHTQEIVLSKLHGKKGIGGRVHVGKKHGIYNVLFVIKQKTKRGVLERTISRSIYVKS